MRRPAIALVTCSAGVLLAAEIAAAALLGVSPARLVVFTSPSSIAPTTCTLNAAPADSYVNSASPGANTGTATTLHVRSGSTGNRRTFVQFGLAPCSIPATALVTTASLRLFLYDAPPANRTYDVHRVSAAWGETTVTWTNQPGVAASATASTATGTTNNVTLSWTVTADVQAFVSGGSNLGWRVRDRVEGAATAQLGRFRSAEFGTAAQRPVLQITYYP